MLQTNYNDRIQFYKTKIKNGSELEKFLLKKVL